MSTKAHIMNDACIQSIGHYSSVGKGGLGGRGGNCPPIFKSRGAMPPTFTPAIVFQVPDKCIICNELH